MLKYIFKSQRGNLLLEVLVALFIIGILLSSASAFPYSLLRSTSILSNRQKALALAEKTVEGLRGVQYEDWALVPVVPFSNPYHISKNVSGWNITTGAENVNDFQVEIFFEQVFRDANGNIAVAGTPDANTTKAKVTVSWTDASGEKNVNLNTYLSNWQNTYDLVLVGDVQGWPFNESVGIETFDIIAGNTGDIIGATWTPGVAGSALHFDGNDHVLVNADLNAILGGTATIAFWLRTSQIGNNTQWLAPGVTGVEQSGTGNDIFWGWIDASGRLGFAAGNGAGIKTISPINDDNWRYYAITRNSVTGFVEVYVNGILNSSGISSAGIMTTSFYSFGRIEDTGGTPVYLNGALDEIRIFERVLSDIEVLNLYNSY